MQTLLEEKTTYHIDDKISVATLKGRVIKFVKENKKYLSQNEQNYLYTFEPRMAYIYGKPKLHKSKKLQEIIKSGNNVQNGVLTADFESLKIPFRPIVSGRNCPISRICELAKNILRPFEKCINHLIIDSNDFLNKLPRQTKRNTTLVAIDVVALYPSIENELGLQALKYWFKKEPDKFLKTFYDEFTLNLIKFIQDNVYFTFDDIIYKQVQE